MATNTTSQTIEELDDAKQKENLKKLEAIFFVSGKFMNMQELISLTDLNPILLMDLLEKLKEKYSKEDSAIEIFEKNGMWKMDVASEYSYVVNKLAGGRSEFTKAEQETLAIIAFKQPIKQSVIIKIRGNKAYDHVKKFSDLDLIKKKKMGHTHELSLSDEFYDYFGTAEFKSANLPAEKEENPEKAEEDKSSVVYLPRLSFKLTESQKKILEVLEKGKYSSVGELAKKVDLSTAMLYRAIDELKDMDLVSTEEGIKLTDAGKIARL